MKNSSENDFIVHYRTGALRGAILASVSAGLIYFSFTLVALISEPYGDAAIFIRLFLFLSLLSVAFVFNTCEEFSVKNYPWLAGGASLLALGGVVCLLSMGPHGARGIEVGASPAFVFGLFLHYTLLRLPLLVASGIGILSSSAYLVWSEPLVIGGNSEVRALVYLFFTNIIGCLMCSWFEDRERELFYQRRYAEAAKKESQEKARAAEEAHAEKARLLAAVSHDLRQPLSAASATVAAFVRRLRRDDFSRAEDYINRIGNSIYIIGETLDHLLMAAKYDSGNESIKVELVNLRGLLVRLDQTFRDQSAEKGLEFRVRLPSDDVYVETDSVALWRVLMNLTSNALKFTESDGGGVRGVVVRCHLKNGRCSIDVVDTGVGISPADQTVVWQPYLQVGEEGARGRGLGLGLFLVRRVLDHLPSHSIRLRSRLGRGSRFTVCLPAIELRDSNFFASDRTPLQESTLSILQGAYVLVLEDDLDSRRAILGLLDDWGVVHASGATLQELIEEAEADGRAPDALITDYRLPGGLTGCQCVVELRRVMEAELPAIVVTGESDLDMIRASLPEDSHLLQKPFDVAVLAGLLLEAVERARRAESDASCSPASEGADGHAI